MGMALPHRLSCGSLAVLPKSKGAMSDAELPARESMEFDVVIVGAGPAGLAAAIRLKQLSPEIAWSWSRRAPRSARISFRAR